MAYLKPQTPLKDLNSGDYFYPLTTIDQIITGTSRLSAFMSEDSSNHNLLNLSNIGNLSVNGTSYFNGQVTATQFNGPLNGNATSATNVAWSGITNKPPYYDIPRYTDNIRFYESSDTHILKLGYWNCTDSYDNLTLLVSSSFWGNQHGSTDIITLRQDLNDNSGGSVKCSCNRVILMNSNRIFYYNIDQTNRRVYLYVYVTGGNSYGKWNTSVLQSSGGSWISEFAKNQPNQSSFVTINGPIVETVTDADAFVKKSGDTMTGTLRVNNAPIFGYRYGQSHNAPAFVFDKPGSHYTGIGANGNNDAIYFGAVSSDGNWNWVTSYKQKWVFNGNITADKVYGAVWNDYAEYRSTSTVNPGQCVVETGLGDLVQSTKRLQPGANIVSDTFGFAIGETEQTKTPIAVSGRVLAYPYEDRDSYQAGDPVCSGPNGTISKMTREEVREYPDRIVGTVSEIPEYETWGTENVKVNGRIWIKVK